jgi:hypothetical protein
MMTKAAQERAIDLGPEIAGKYADSSARFHIPQEQRRLRVGIPFMCVRGIRTFAEKGIGFVEEEDGVFPSGLVENAGKVLFRLINEFAYHGLQVDAVQVKPQRPCQDSGCHGLPCSLGPGKQEKQTGARRVETFGTDRFQFFQDVRGKSLLIQRCLEPDLFDQ